MAGQRSEIGRYEEESFGSLPGLARGIMVALFQMDGITHCVTLALNRFVRKVVPAGPRCFR